MAEPPQLEPPRDDARALALLRRHALWRHWQRGLAVLLSAWLTLQAIAAAAQLTLVEGNSRSWGDYLLLTVGTLGPAIAALLVAHAVLVDDRRPLRDGGADTR